MNERDTGWNEYPALPDASLGIVLALSKGMDTRPKSIDTSPVMMMSEVCDLLRIHRGTVYRLIQTGQIPYFRMGSDYRFNREAIGMWSQAQEQKSMR